MKRLIVFAAVAALASGLAAAQAPVQEETRPTAAAPAAETSETLGFTSDESRRMTVAVDIDGRGPYPFIVDTGAERTVVSLELAEALGLPSLGDVTLATVANVRRVPSVQIESMRVGRRTLNDIRAPALDRADMGAMGMLGVDSLRSQRVDFDFQRQELTLSNSHIDDDNWPRDTIVITGRTRLGRLILTDATVDGQRVRVIIDTGSQQTVGNMELRRRLQARGRLGQIGVMELIGVTGDRVSAEYAVTRRLRLGGLHVNDMPIAFADFQLFSHLGLEQRPAILLGMDALRLFGRVSIDFANRRVRLLPTESRIDNQPTRLAAAAVIRTGRR
ncbi:MAG TPA: retropepsin-like aspartic protease [Allosphingosinicella sp.]|nr:retropepsin-like aspartic protease [Allosphingosinicella sp.]